MATDELPINPPSTDASEPPTLLVALATGPVLLGLVAATGIQTNLIDLGKQSEELFRGERLPILDLPLTPEG
ncbi:hypothetical protein [Leptolyngbya sp. FACHB-261]|uniref:hypothetical protein n=1 Tax=Leptolyngbya sp. FACHB-261 TaxID=2692806 RepID=UPI001688915B|nr:hypothetical protein [Leptolyngbya sp. FACHB-261]MBD2100912.1 hypothetical protein [Leptolyngbya sp. FACHB-261]